MATPRLIRKLALLALYQLDARGEQDAEHVRASLSDTNTLAEEGLALDEDETLTERDLDRAFALALDAYHAREQADRVLLELAPDWPPHRQAAIDRAILRLGYFEICSNRTPPKDAINEAVELARSFSTEKSPSFINGLLAAVYKRHADTPGAEPEP
ncbi:MAG: transcription antitermination factor NusB [Planctomycetota bacterium]|nr:MAG: transcription antitermination factor NusB [Planctomycetota bacterium]